MNVFRPILICLLLITITIPAQPSHRIVRDNQITWDEARTLAANAGKNSSFLLVINEDVLKQLNKMLGSPGRRRHLRESLRRMRKFESMISKKLIQNNMPQELLALPLIESSYQNIHSEHGWGSGLWMLIKLTARGLGLKVNAKTDQRLDVEKSTDAALKYLKNNHRKFKDWHLTVMAFNMGENKVLHAMKKVGSKDPWKLIEKGHERDKGYLAKVIAGAIIIRNEGILRYPHKSKVKK